MPSRSRLQAWAKTVGPSPSICSLNRTPGEALARIDASVAFGVKNSDHCGFAGRTPSQELRAPCRVDPAVMTIQPSNQGVVVARAGRMLLSPGRPVLSGSVPNSVSPGHSSRQRSSASLTKLDTSTRRRRGGCSAPAEATADGGGGPVRAGAFSLAPVIRSSDRSARVNRFRRRRGPPPLSAVDSPA
jgi:hypothetical protein